MLLDLLSAAKDRVAAWRYLLRLRGAARRKAIAKRLSAAKP